MNITEIIVAIIVMGLITFALRGMPFVWADSFRKSRLMAYLSNVLPACVMVILVMYTLKGINPFADLLQSLVKLVPVFIVIVVHIFKRSILLSITSGTVVYMLLSKLFI